MSSTSPQHPTWVFPPGGAPSNNIEQTSSFGPVHLDDSMVLQWTPDIVAKTLQLVCFTQSHGKSQRLLRHNTNSPQADDCWWR